MSKLIILGTSNAVPTEDHENTHMVLVGGEHSVLIDCASSPILRLERAGVNPNDLTDLILTHFHPDHVSGVPLLLMDMWLMGRRRPLNIHGLDYTLDRLKQLMAAFDWSNWPNFFPVIFNPLPEKEMTQALDCGEWRVFASPVCHMIPTIGLRIEFRPSGKVLAYSCDTEPCPQVVQLAENADVLIHESTGEAPGHTSAAQAGQIAAQAQAKTLYLIHYNARQFQPEILLADAGKTFGEDVKIARDFMELEF
jgi:ribonuclease Z